MEERDLAKDMKKEQKDLTKYYENVRLELSKIVLDNITIGEVDLSQRDSNETTEEATVYEVYIDFKGEKTLIATINASGKLVPNKGVLQDPKYSKEDIQALGNMLNLLGLEQEEVDLNKIQEQLKNLDAKTKEEIQKKTEEERSEEEAEKEQYDDEEEQKDDKKEMIDKEKEQIAERYNLSAKQVVHVNMQDEKITRDETFRDLVKWADGKTDIFILQGKDEHTWKIIGRDNKNREYTEIEGATKQLYGKNPDITIKRIDGEQIREVKPLAVYDVDGKSVIAIVKNQYGEPEQLYCRKQEGEEKYWGAVVPEYSSKNIRQMEYGKREFMSHEFTSAADLAKKEDELAKAQDLNDRGVPSKEEGVQIYEIDGNNAQNHEQRKEKIVEDLMKKDGIVDKITVPPGYYEHKADKILELLNENEKTTYEEAVEKVEHEGQREERRKNTSR